MSKAEFLSKVFMFCELAWTADRSLVCVCMQDCACVPAPIIGAT